MFLKLSDFFQPLNFQTLIYFVLIFIFFDVLGSFIKRFLLRPEKADESRVINWIIGLGFFVFIWFILGFFILPNTLSIVCSIGVLSLISLPSYLKNKQFIGLLKVLWSLKVPILIIAPFLPAVFVKASLPPYYSDEMAYHFISPSALIRDLGVFWRFNGGLYMNLPRLFDTFFILIFSLTKTYSIVRLFHFTILATAMLYAYTGLKKNFGTLTGILFVFAFFSLPIDIVFTSTLGFVDVATYSFMLIGFIAGIDYLAGNNLRSLLLSSIFWAMALGSKYTPVTAILSFGIPLTFIAVKSRKKYLRNFSKTFFLKILLIFLVFGGYWYVKNLIAYGNPIYPFIFRCYRFASEWCGASSNFFGNWTTPITLSNARTIIESIFPRNPILQFVILISPFLVLLNQRVGTKKISLLILSAVIIELLILKKFSGFYARYHQHIELWILALVAIQVANKYKTTFLRVLTTLLYIVLAFSLVVNYIRTLKHTDSLRFLNWNEINYSIGRMDIYDWVRYTVPRMADATFWCEDPPGGNPVALARFDPDMIWYENDGMMRSFLTNCYYENPPLEGLDINEIIPVALEKKMEFWTATPNKCITDRSKVVKRFPYEDEHAYYLRKLNNEIVCNSQEVLPNLYYFNYKNINGNTKI